MVIPVIERMFLDLEKIKPGVLPKPTILCKIYPHRNPHPLESGANPSVASGVIRVMKTKP